MLLGCCNIVFADSIIAGCPSDSRLPLAPPRHRQLMPYAGRTQLTTPAHQQPQLCFVSSFVRQWSIHYLASTIHLQLPSLECSPSQISIKSYYNIPVRPQTPSIMISFIHALPCRHSSSSIHHPCSSALPVLISLETFGYENEEYHPATMARQANRAWPDPN